MGQSSLQLTLQTPLGNLPGIGPERSARLARLKLFTLEDLLLHRPHRYEDRRKFRSIAELRLHESAVVRARNIAQGVKYTAQRRKSLFEMILEDGSGRLHCRWWNQPYLQKQFEIGREYLIFGKATWIKPPTFDQPEVEQFEEDQEESIHLGRIVPVYPLTEGLMQRWLRAWIWRLLPQAESLWTDPWPRDAFPDLLRRSEAVQALHFPQELAEAEKARQRLALNEFYSLQSSLVARRKSLEAHGKGLPCGGDNRWIRPFLSQLSYSLTQAQTRILRELRQEMGGPLPMRRLLQGDVGSGKTVVAACTALMAMESGYQAVLMAPTEILAEQHFRSFVRWFHPLGLDVQLWTGSHKMAAAEQKPRLAIGTHALLESSISFDRLGLVIIDEQHKFGVTQRETLLRKGHYPHLLVMTATPIPRTLALTVYGDLDVSVLDEMPPGRGRVRTFLRSPDSLPKVWDFIRKKLSEGNQAYVVYPLVEESDKIELKAVTSELESLQRILHPFQVGLLHGRLKSEEKERVMSAFRRHELHALLATSVIEVGVDVPNATLLLIEDAQQFGLAQLHQLRGRIGRGARESYCILVADPQTPEARERLQVLTESQDGFHIAEADMRLRGPGELLGQQQSGLPDFRFGDLVRDQVLVEHARRMAMSIK